MMAAREFVTMGGGGIGVEGEGPRWPNILVRARLNSLVINRSCTRACTVAHGKTRGREYTRANGRRHESGNRPDYKGRSRVRALLIAANFDVASLNNSLSYKTVKQARTFFPPGGICLQIEFADEVVESISFYQFHRSNLNEIFLMKNC